MIKVADENRKNKMILIFVIIIAIFLIYRLALGFFQNIEVSVEYDEGIMECEITDDNIIYKINGLSVIHTKHEVVNTNNETLVFITNGMLMQNKVHSHWETWKSLAQANRGEKPYFNSTHYIDIKNDMPDCRDKIKVYHRTTSLNKIKKADKDKLKQIIDNSQLICESE